MSTNVSNIYFELLQKFPPRPIKSEAERQVVQEVVDSLLDGEITPEEQEYLNLLGILIYEYEEKSIAIPDLSGVELLKALIDEFGLKQKDLISIFKTESIVSAILNGKRKFTVEHIEKLAEFFHVSPAVFFPQPSAIAPRSSK
ncbi:helix-turn-helix domain-containing protein [Gloeocapsopsis dulcis]|uniref:Transcriptional regulator n=1 Tax=Gloeocapsopsis dulcis AAB1 = 1H9 TaxID=1433147 RepID=A0A6N8FW78_9CHRO|nr:helix-turn-helix domain-containing protein [Gloeocapsopsis dulcis]MUL36862.1 transcriptional regulator [Gloeocapsopsis dulcis AAB1 = 1H9]WNN88530.1 helix-turn-helix domain-containing protein [Gloeocapsopsis dulcis]